MTTIKVALSRMTLSPDGIRYDVDAGQLLDIISDHSESRGHDSIAGSSSKFNRINPRAVNDGLVTGPSCSSAEVSRSVVHDGAAPSQPLDQALIDAVAKAHLALKRLTDGSKQSIATVADSLKMDASDLSRILPLAFLSPRILEMILTGRQPPNLTLRSLTRGTDLPVEWSQQEALLLA